MNTPADLGFSNWSKMPFCCDLSRYGTVSGRQHANDLDRGLTMPIERELSKVFAMSDNDFIRWREDAREALAESADEVLQAVYKASGQEIVLRAERAWAAAAGHNRPREEPA
jgi:hypothetical protein